MCGLGVDVGVGIAAQAEGEVVSVSVTVLCRILAGSSSYAVFTLFLREGGEEGREGQVTCISG